MPHPVILPWSSQSEFEELKSWFYGPQSSNDPEQVAFGLRQRAVQRVPLFLELALTIRFKPIKLGQSMCLQKSSQQPS